jgi:hypothetical protein
MEVKLGCHSIIGGAGKWKKYCNPKRKKQLTSSLHMRWSHYDVQALFGPGETIPHTYEESQFTELSDVWYPHNQFRNSRPG